MNSILSLLWYIFFEKTCDMSHLSCVLCFQYLWYPPPLGGGHSLKQIGEHCSLSLPNKITQCHSVTGGSIVSSALGFLTNRGADTGCKVNECSSCLVRLFGITGVSCVICVLCEGLLCSWVCVCLYVNNGFSKKKSVSEPDRKHCRSLLIS